MLEKLYMAMNGTLKAFLEEITGKIWNFLVGGIRMLVEAGIVKTILLNSVIELKNKSLEIKGQPYQTATKRMAAVCPCSMSKGRQSLRMMAEVSKQNTEGAVRLPVAAYNKIRVERHDLKTEFIIKREVE